MSHVRPVLISDRPTNRKPDNNAAISHTDLATFAAPQAAYCENPKPQHLLLEEKSNLRPDSVMLPMQDQQEIKPDQHSEQEMRTEKEKPTQTLFKDTSAEAE